MTEIAQHPHPVLACLDAVESALKDVADVEPAFMTTAQKRAAPRGCRVKAAWTEAHHLRRPWSQGGTTDLDDGTLLCCFHHHRAHDPRYQTQVHPDGDLTFHRRT